MIKIIYIIFLILLTYSCQNLKKGLGIEKDAPDEFLIKKVDPIEQPPNFELLPPGSQIKKSSNRQNSTKKIIDGNLKRKSSDTNIKQNETNKVEKEILKNIKKND
tara:strand:+ start:1406 stop:1720 length:315 start_codon:yes stop_codon:yes gene_type:complete